MASSEIDSSLALSVPGSGLGARSISRTRDILIETMQLVEPRKQSKVPNHLLESKVYSKISQNQVIQSEPSVLHFGGFEPGQVQKQVFQLTNVSTEVERIHIIPPQTKYFYVKYTKGDRLVPGLSIECTVEFSPDEWRYYYDCIRVHCRGEENLVIPIHAYPVMNTSDFPQIVTFPPVPVGHTRSKVLPLRCQAPIDFEFQLTYMQPHPAFRVEPMSGIVPANGEVDVIVTFSPKEFSTALMKLQLMISQFSAKPLVCTFTGSSGPGLAKEMTEKIYQQEQIDLAKTYMTLDPRAISPLDRARSKKQGKEHTKVKQHTSVNEVEKDGVKFPADLDTPYAVAQVLNQQPGKLRIKDLRDVVLSRKGNTGAPTRQMKEAVFEMAIRRNVYEERQNQLRWQVKVGEDQIKDKARQDVIEAREQSWQEYKTKRGDPVAEEEYQRQKNHTSSNRTRRECSDLAGENAQFDDYKNDPWDVRHAALYRFQQAARKIIIQLRADHKLKGLRQMVIDWGERKYNLHVTNEEREMKEENEEQDELEQEMPLQVSKVTIAGFPTYVAPDVKDDMAVDALGSVSCPPTTIVVKRKTPYHDLKVPQQYVLMDYKRHDVHAVSRNYVSPSLARPLRTGAEDELIVLDDSEIQPLLQNIVEADLQVEDMEESSPEMSTVAEPVVPIKPPPALLRPMQYPALHIFNPAPGLQVYQAPLPYSEIDADFHLCPIPSYTSNNVTNPHMTTQKHYLDRQDTIRGTMNWKKFPSQGLTSLSSTATMSGVWLPRWDDPFSNSLLPSEVPELYSGLSEDDSNNIVSDPGDDEGVTLTPEMVLAEFQLIEETEADEKSHKDDEFPHGNKMPSTNVPVGPHGPVSREKREQELDHFLNSKYNRLGSKIEARLHHQNSLKTNPQLHLK